MSSFSDERKTSRKQIASDMWSLMENRGNRIRNMDKMREADLKELTQTARDLINKFPFIRCTFIEIQQHQTQQIDIYFQESWTPCGR